MGSEGRRSSAYRRVAAEFKTGAYPCWICGERPGTTVDHQPPLSAFPHHTLWQGVYKPACKPCQDSQGGKIGVRALGRTPRPRSRQW